MWKMTSLGRKKNERTCLENLLKTMSQTRQLFSPSQHTPKVRKRIKRLDQKVCFTRKAGGEVIKVHHSLAPAPPSHLGLATGLSLLSIQKLFKKYMYKIRASKLNDSFFFLPKGETRSSLKLYIGPFCTRPFNFKIL